MDALARLAPEERLLLALGRLEPSEGDREAARAAPEAPSFSWARALDLACYHRVHLLLASNLDDPSLFDLVPAEVQRRLLDLRIAAELRNERYAHAVAGAFARLDAEGIPVLLLKGAALCATVFPPGSRPLNDVDLLIRPEDYRRVAGALEEAGFRKIPESRTEREMLRDAHEASFVRRIRNETLALDVHWRLFAPDRSPAPSLGYELPVADLLARATPAALGPARALAPSREDLFVHAATQIGIDGLQAHLGRLADLDVLVRRGLDGRRLAEIARAARAGGITHLALSLARMLGSRVPEEALRRLAAAGGIASEVAAAPEFPFERLRTAARVALIPLLFGRPSDRVLYGLSLVLPTRRARRLHLLRAPRSLADYLLRWRVMLLAALCGAVLIAQRAADAVGCRRLAARLRARLWHAARPAATAPERAARQPAQLT